MGQEATEFVKALVLENKKVRHEFDVQKKDRYGRLLAYVYYEIMPAMHPYWLGFCLAVENLRC